eukprot:3573-Heterococcus_DN1.PRE.2
MNLILAQTLCLLLLHHVLCEDDSLCICHYYCYQHCCYYCCCNIELRVPQRLVLAHAAAAAAGATTDAIAANGATGVALCHSVL